MCGWQWFVTGYRGKLGSKGSNSGWATLLTFNWYPDTRWHSSTPYSAPHHHPNLKVHCCSTLLSTTVPGDMFAAPWIVYSNLLCIVDQKFQSLKQLVIWVQDSTASDVSMPSGHMSNIHITSTHSSEPGSSPVYGIDNDRAWAWSRPSCACCDSKPTTQVVQCLSHTSVSYCLTTLKLQVWCQAWLRKFHIWTM